MKSPTRRHFLCLRKWRFSQTGSVQTSRQKFVWTQWRQMWLKAPALKTMTKVRNYVNLLEKRVRFYMSVLNCVFSMLHCWFCVAYRQYWNKVPIIARRPCEDMPLGARTGLESSIGPILARFWHTMACLQRSWPYSFKIKQRWGTNKSDACFNLSCVFHILDMVQECWNFYTRCDVTGDNDTIVWFLRAPCWYIGPTAMPRAAVTPIAPERSEGAIGCDSRPRHCRRDDIPAWRLNKITLLALLPLDLTMYYHFISFLRAVQSRVGH